MSEAIQKRPIEMGDRGLSLRNFDDMFRFCDVFVKSGLAPEGDTTAKVMIKLQAGLELGFQPMQALQTLVVTDKGRLSMMAVGMLALIRRSPLCRNADVYIEGAGEERVAVFLFEREGLQERKVTFSVDDAKVARLWGKKTKNGYDTPWITSPEDMLIARAISRGAKRYWSDVLLGIEAQEVIRDIEEPRLTAAVDAQVRGTTPALALMANAKDPLFDVPDVPPERESVAAPADENGEVAE